MLQMLDFVLHRLDCGFCISVVTLQNVICHLDWDLSVFRTHVLDLHVSEL